MPLSKKRTHLLIDTFAPYFIKQLRLIPKNIRFYVVSYSSTVARENGHNEEIMGCSISKRGKARIYIYYDTHFTERQALGTLLHELLHYKFHCLNIAKGKHEGVEEEIIKVFEKLYLDNLQNKILSLYLR